MRNREAAAVPRSDAPAAFRMWLQWQHSFFMPWLRSMPRFSLFIIALSAAVLAGCSSIEVEPGSEPSQQLTETPSRAVASCVSTKPLSAQDSFESLEFKCEQLDSTSTLSELIDAGWRLESVNVGKQSNLNGVISMPITITIRKLF